MILVLLLFDAMGIFWLVEQPKGSMMQNWGRFEWFIMNRVVHRHQIKMVDFGGESAKPTWLYSNMPWICELDLYKPTTLVHRQKKALASTWVDASGKNRCAGNSDTKASQAYPKEFGDAVCMLAESHRADLVIAANAAEDNAKQWKARRAFSPGKAYVDPWADADLLPVVAMCGM